MKNKILKVILSLFVVLTLLLSLPIFVFGEDEIFFIREGYYVKDAYVDSSGLVTGFNDIFFTFVSNPASSTVYHGMSFYVNSSGVVQEIYYIRLVDDYRSNILVYTSSAGWNVPLTIYVLADAGVTETVEMVFLNNYTSVENYYFLAVYQSGYDGGYEEGYSEGYSDGVGESYDLGYADGSEDGFNSAKQIWYEIGFDQGYEAGYNEGLDNSGNFLSDLLGNSISAVASVFDIDIIGSFSLGDLLLAVFGVVFTMLFLKFIAGG